MKRALLGLAVAAATLFVAPQTSAAGVVYCGITPRFPCGVCFYDPTTGTQRCLTIRDIDA